MSGHWKARKRKVRGGWEVEVLVGNKVQKEWSYFTTDKKDAEEVYKLHKKLAESENETNRVLARLGRPHISKQPRTHAERMKRRKNPAKSQAQFRWAYAAHARGELTNKQLKEIVGNANYKKLPKRKKTKRKAKMARTRRKRKVRRRKNYSVSDLPPAAYTKRWYKVGRRKRKLSAVEAAALRQKGRSVKVTTAPKTKSKSKRKKSTRKGGRRKTARRAYQKSSSTRRRWYKVGRSKKYITPSSAERYRKKGYKVTLTKAPAGKRSTTKGRKRKTARRAYTKKRKSSRKKSTRGKRWYKVGRRKMFITKSSAEKYRKKGYKVRLSSPQKTPKRGQQGRKRTASGRRKRKTTRRRRKVSRKRSPRRKLTKAERRRIALKNLKKARAALKRKRKGRKRRGRPRKKLGKRSVVRRAARKVKKKRPGTSRSKIRRIAMRDYRRKGHKRGKRKVKRLAKDVMFELDFGRAYKKQKLGRSRYRKKVKRMGRHPDHLDKRKTTRKTRKGWKEFAGYAPNLVTKMSKSPVKGTFNGVLIDEIQGKLAHSRTSVTIKPPKNAPLYLIWASGGRTFEVVGSTKAITSLAKGMARGGEPIEITRINYLAPTYAVPAGHRRTGREEMYVAYTHKIKHEAYLTWNERSGSKARFPIITKGTRGRSMVNRSGIIL